MGRGVRSPVVERSQPTSTERHAVLRLGPSVTRSDVFRTARTLLAELDSCSVYASPLDTSTGCLDIVVLAETWTRQARRRHLQQRHRPQPRDIPTNNPDPILMARLLVDELEMSNRRRDFTTNRGGGRGLQMTVAWTFGHDRIRFESFAMFVLGAVERQLLAQIGAA